MENIGIRTLLRQQCAQAREANLSWIIREHETILGNSFGKTAHPVTTTISCSREPRSASNQSTYVNNIFRLAIAETRVWH